jgi:hypothetical protein
MSQNATPVLTDAERDRDDPERPRVREAALVEQRRRPVAERAEQHRARAEHGARVPPATSSAASATIAPIRPRSPCNAFVDTATGRSTAAPSPVRAGATTHGDTSSTATLMSRNELPQISEVRQNTIHARRLTAPTYPRMARVRPRYETSPARGASSEMAR